LTDWVAVVRGAAEATGCLVADVLRLLSVPDREELATGRFTLADLVTYVRGCQSTHGALFGRGV